MLTTKDFTDSKATLKYIAHAQDGTESKPLSKALEIMAFFLTGFTAIFFGANGKPKNLVQLILAIPDIIKLVRDTAKLINESKGDTVQAKRIAGLRGKPEMPPTTRKY